MAAKLDLEPMSSHVGSIINHTASLLPFYREKIQLHGKGASGFVGVFEGSALRDSSSDLPLTPNFHFQLISWDICLSLVCQSQRFSQSLHLSA